MNCQTVRKTLSLVVDRNLGGDASDRVSQHLAECRDCAMYSEEVQTVRALVRDLPAAAPPPRLFTQLQVIASRERVRRLSHNTLAALAHFWAEELRLMVDNLMRPFAIPFAGGLASAVFLFTILVPTLQFQHLTHNDVPSGLFTQSDATVDTMPPFGFSEDQGAIVELMLDDKGRVVDFSIPKGNDTPQLRNDIANMILFTTFNPATVYGQPIPGKVLVSFRRSRIVVKG
jgi:hypothetical protein